MKFSFVRGASLLSVAALLSFGPTGIRSGFPDQLEGADENAGSNGHLRHLASGDNNGNANKKNYLAKGPPPGDDDDEIGVIVKWKNQTVSENWKGHLCIYYAFSRPWQHLVDLH